MSETLYLLARDRAHGLSACRTRGLVCGRNRPLSLFLQEI